MTMRSNHPQREEIDRIAKLLMDTWAKAEPDHGVTKYPTSYIATFVDMARVVVEDHLAELDRLKAADAEAVRWARRTTEGIEILKAERDALLVRQQELLATIVRVTNSTPFADEAKDALDQRGKLVAEIGTLRAEIERLKALIGDAAAQLEARSDRAQRLWVACDLRRKAQEP